MHDKNVLRVSLEVVVALLSDLIKEGKGRTMVIRPVVVGHSAPKVALCVVSCSLACVDDVVFVAVFLI